MIEKYYIFATYNKVFVIMKVSILQHNIFSGALSSTLSNLENQLLQHPGADLYVLAETFATGFLAEGSSALAQEQGPLIFSWMQQQAARHDAAIAGSVAVKDDEGRLRNRMYFVRPDGTYDYYDKRHLFSYAGETREYAAGCRRVVVEWRGVRFLLQVCYDLRFPVFSRSRGDYDAIIYVANWPEKRQDAWQTLLKARAIENQCYVIGVNRVGSDAACLYAGGSVVLDAYGRTIASCARNIDEVSAAALDMNELVRFRAKFPVLSDADDFSLD